MKELSEEEIEYAIAAHRLGISTSAIARKIHCRQSTLSAELKNRGERLVSGRQKSYGLKEDYFDHIDSKQKAYFLGLLFTDGCISHDKQGRSPHIRIELLAIDMPILCVLRDELGITNSITYYERDGRNTTATLSVRSQRLSDALETYGVVGNKTYVTKSLPIIHSDYIPAFLHGLIDGDGSLYFSKGYWHINFCSHSEDICRDFERLCAKLIGKENKLKIQCSNGVYRVTFNGQWAIALAKACMFDGCGIFRKRLLAEQMINEECG